MLLHQLRCREERPFDVPLTRQHMLGERGAVVGGVGLFTNQGERPVVALATQRLDEAPSREARAYDDDVVGRLQRAHEPNIASHCSGDEGASTKLNSRTSPIRALGSGEYM